MRAELKLILEFHSFSPEITTAYDGSRANEASDCLIEMISHSDLLYLVNSHLNLKTTA